MKLPGGERAFVDIAKIIHYCLSIEHPRGRHKVRVFASALGLTVGDAHYLRLLLLDVARTYEATPTEQDEHGQRFVLDFIMQGPNDEVTVRSTWIVRTEEDFPRLTSCYVL